MPTDQPTLREIVERNERRKRVRGINVPSQDIDALLALVREARDVVQDYQNRHAADAPEFSDCPCTACAGAAQFMAKARED